MVLSVFAFHILIDSVDHRRSKFLAAKTVSSAGYDDIFSIGFVKRGDYVEIERLACATAFFYSVEYCDSLYACRYCVCKHLCGEWTVKSYFEYAVLAASCVEIVDCFAYCVCAAAHNYDNRLCVVCAVILIRFIFASGDCLDVFHSLFDDLRYSVVITVASFAVLEIDIWILRRTFLYWVLRVERTLAEFVDIRHIFLVDSVLDI